MVYTIDIIEEIGMITIIDTPFGYYTYNIDNLWTGLSQMGKFDVDETAN